MGLSHGGGVGARLAGQTRSGVHHEGEVAHRTRCAGIGVGIDVGAVVGTWRTSNVGVAHTASIVAVGHCTVQARKASRGEVRWGVEIGWAASTRGGVAHGEGAGRTGLAAVGVGVGKGAHAAGVTEGGTSGGGGAGWAAHTGCLTQRGLVAARSAG